MKRLSLILVALLVLLLCTGCGVSSQLEFSYSVPKTEYKADETINLTIALTNTSKFKYRYFGKIYGPDVSFHFESCDGNEVFTCDFNVSTAEKHSYHSMKSGQTRNYSFYATIPVGISLGEYNLVVRTGNFTQKFENAIKIVE